MGNYFTLQKIPELKRYGLGRGGPLTVRNTLIILGLAAWLVLQLAVLNQLFPGMRTWDTVSRVIIHGVGAVVAVATAAALISRKKKFTACCSMDIYNALSELGFTSPYMTCPLPSDVNYNKLMANPKEYRYVILDANSGSGFTVDDIERAILQSKTVNIIIRFDESTYSGMDIKWMQHAFKQAGVPVCSTLQLFNLLTKYYGKQKN